MTGSSDILDRAIINCLVKIKVTGVFARRGYNVQSLAVGPSERDGMSRISTVIPGDGPIISKLVKQLNKVVGVQQVTDITDLPFVSLELMLIKVQMTNPALNNLHDLITYAPAAIDATVAGNFLLGYLYGNFVLVCIQVRCSLTQRVELKNIAEIFRGSICDMSANTVTIQVEGREDKMKAMFAGLGEYGILEVARTGRIAIPRESGVNTKYLETRQMAKLY